MFPILIFLIVLIIKAGDEIFPALGMVLFIYTILVVIFLFICHEKPPFYRDNFVMDYKPIPIEMVDSNTKVEDYIYYINTKSYEYYPNKVIMEENGDTDYDFIELYIYKPKIYFYIFVPVYALAMKNAQIHIYNKSVKKSNKKYYPIDSAIINDKPLIVE